MYRSESTDDRDSPDTDDRDDRDTERPDRPIASCPHSIQTSSGRCPRCE